MRRSMKRQKKGKSDRKKDEKADKSKSDKKRRTREKRIKIRNDVPWPIIPRS